MLLGIPSNVLFQRFLQRLPTIGLVAALAGLLSACAIGGPPDGFFDEGEGGYSAAADSHSGGSAVVGDPTSTTGNTEESGGDGGSQAAERASGDDGDDGEDCLPDEQDPQP